MLYAVILAAGKSTRFNSKIKKQFTNIKNKPVLYYSIDKFLKIKLIDFIILAIDNQSANSLYLKKLVLKYKKFLNNSKIEIVIGGSERYDSVYNSIEFIKYKYNITNKDNILIHDAARPNFDINDVTKLISCLKKYKSISLGYNITDTIKKISSTNSQCIYKINKTINRNNYYLISTPQAFNLKLLYNSYVKFKSQNSKKHITDDLQIIENFSNVKSYVLNSSKLNFKITTNEELLLLQNLI